MVPTATSASRAIISMVECSSPCSAKTASAAARIASLRACRSRRCRSRTLIEPLLNDDSFSELKLIAPKVVNVKWLGSALFSRLETRHVAHREAAIRCVQRTQAKACATRNQQSGFSGVAQALACVFTDESCERQLPAFSPARSHLSFPRVSGAHEESRIGRLVAAMPTPSRYRHKAANSPDDAIAPT